MKDLIVKTNEKLTNIVNDLYNLKSEYESDIRETQKKINVEKEEVDRYKKEFNDNKKSIKKMNKEIEDFEKDYQNLVEKFKDDELENILVAANREITAKIDERKKRIIKTKEGMNSVVISAKNIQKRLIKLNAENKMYEDALKEISGIYEYYNEMLEKVVKDSKKIKDITVSEKEEDDNIFKDEVPASDIEEAVIEVEETKEEAVEEEKEDNTKEDSDYEKALEEILSYDDALEE